MREFMAASSSRLNCGIPLCCSSFHSSEKRPLSMYWYARSRVERMKLLSSVSKRESCPYWLVWEW